MEEKSGFVLNVLIYLRVFSSWLTKKLFYDNKYPQNTLTFVKSNIFRLELRITF